MKRLALLTITCVTTLFLAACEDPRHGMDDQPQGTLDVPELTAAHNAYLDRDYTAMTNHVYGVLTDPDAAMEVRDNGLQLLDHAYGENKGRLPASWRVPAPLKSVRIKHIRIEEPDKLSFQVAVAGIAPSADVVTHVRLSAANGDVLLDRTGSVGTWSTFPEDDGSVYWEVEGPETSRPAHDGLYWLELGVAGGKRVTGWFPMTSMVSTDAPSIASPRPDQIFQTRNPQIAWTDFRSPEYRDYERRAVSVWVIRLNGTAPVDWSPTWSLWESPAVTTSATIGRTTGVGQTVKPIDLQPGRYWMGITYSEQREFGDLRLVRSSRTSRPFVVQ